MAITVTWDGTLAGTKALFVHIGKVHLNSGDTRLNYRISSVSGLVFDIVESGSGSFRALPQNGQLRLPLKLCLESRPEFKYTSDYHENTEYEKLPEKHCNLSPL